MGLGAAASAGTMASRSGRLSVAPMPRSIVRRDSFIFEINISGSPVNCLITSDALFKRNAFLKRSAVDYTQNDRRKTVVGLRGLAHDRAHRRHVVGLKPPAEGVNHQLFRDRADKKV